jgi:hypothetical protein
MQKQWIIFRTKKRVARCTLKRDYVEGAMDGSNCWVTGARLILFPVEQVMAAARYLGVAYSRLILKEYDVDPITPALSPQALREFDKWERKNPNWINEMNEELNDGNDGLHILE